MPNAILQALVIAAEWSSFSKTTSTFKSYSQHGCFYFTYYFLPFRQYLHWITACFYIWALNERHLYGLGKSFQQKTLMSMIQKYAKKHNF
jgi:hypothetical protein